MFLLTDAGDKKNSGDPTYPVLSSHTYYYPRGSCSSQLKQENEELAKPDGGITDTKEGLCLLLLATNWVGIELKTERRCSSQLESHACLIGLAMLRHSS